MNEKLLNDEVNFMITNASKKELFDYIVGLKIQSKKYKEVIDKANTKLKQYRSDLKDYQEQDRINHKNVSIGLVGVKIRCFEEILKDVE